MQDNITHEKEKQSLSRSLITSLITACFCVCQAAPVNALIYVCIALYIFCTVKLSTRPAGYLKLLLSPIIAFLILPSVGSTVLLVSIAFSSAAGGVMLYRGKNSRTAFIASTVLAYIAAFIITGSYEIALGTLATLPIAIVLAVSFKKKVSRLPCICALTAAMLITLLIPLFIAVSSSHGGDIHGFISELRESFADITAAYFEEMNQALGEKMTELIDISLIREMALSVFTLIPAFLTAAVGIFAFLVHYLGIIMRHNTDDEITVNETAFMLSRTSAWLYIISSLLMLFSFGGSRGALVLATAMQSLNIILSPAFVFAGLNTFLSPIAVAKRRSALGTVLMVIAVIYFGVFLIYPLALFGAFSTLKRTSRANTKSNL